MAFSAYKKKYLNGKENLNNNTESGPWLITLDAPSLIPFLEHCKKSSLRKEIYLEHLNKASKEPFDNRSLLEKILLLRQEKAELLGFKNFAELSIEEKMAASTSDIYDLEDKLLRASYPVAQEEISALKALAEKQGETKELKQWDIAYWSKRLEEETFGFSEDEIKPFFPIEKVLEGLFDIAQKLLKIRILRSQQEDSNLWHSDVMFFDVHDQNTNEKIASFYLDAYHALQVKEGSLDE